MIKGHRQTETDRDTKLKTNVLQDVKEKLLRRSVIAYIVLAVTIAAGATAFLDFYEKLHTVSERVNRTLFVVTTESNQLKRYSFAKSPINADVFPGGFEYVMRFSNSQENSFPVRLISLELEHEYSTNSALKVVREPGVAAGTHRAHVFRVRINGETLEETTWQLRTMKAGEQITPSRPPNILSVPDEFFVAPGEAETIKGRILAKAPGIYRVRFKLKYTMGNDEYTTRFDPVTIVR